MRSSWPIPSNGRSVELPVNCRKIFVWQKIEGLTQAEIAERLGLSKNMVEKYMIRTLRHLRDRLDGLQS